MLLSTWPRNGGLLTVSRHAPKAQTVIHEQMRKSILFLILLTLLFTVSAEAQNTYQFDNFSFENGVRVQLPPPAVTKPNDKTGRKLIANRNFKYTPPSGALVHLTSQQINPSMGGFTTGNSDVDG